VKVILETDWLLLRECAEDDAEVFFKLNTDPQVLRFVPDKPLLEQPRAINGGELDGAFELQPHLKGEFIDLSQ
jgi:hypothetical protein